MKNTKQITVTAAPMDQKEEGKHELAQKVLAIIKENHLNLNEIQVLFGAGKQNAAGKNIDHAAERIINLFILEKLTIEEGKDVLKEVTDSLPRETDLI